MVGPIALGVLQPEMAITANQQAANLIARLQQNNKANAPPAPGCWQICP
jgi:hypothetical protein